MGNEGKEELEQERVAPKKKKNNLLKIIKTTWNIIEKILIVLLIFISIIIVTQRVSNNEKAFLGLRLFRVQTGSMIPKYQIGDVILVKETQLDKIEIGDDVTYNGTSGVMNGKIVTHQVVDIQEVDGQKVFQTKGIANNTPDPLVYGGQINGVVQAKMHILTAICTAVTNKYILYFCAILPITIFIFFAFAKGNKTYEE